MAEISKELEARIKLLNKKGKPIETVSMVQQELQLGLRNSKDIVDKYRDENK